MTIWVTNSSTFTPIVLRLSPDVLFSVLTAIRRDGISQVERAARRGRSSHSLDAYLANLRVASATIADLVDAPHGKRFE